MESVAGLRGKGKGKRMASRVYFSLFINNITRHQLVKRVKLNFDYGLVSGLVIIQHFSLHTEGGALDSNDGRLKPIKLLIEAERLDDGWMLEPVIEVICLHTGK